MWPTGAVLAAEAGASAGSEQLVVMVGGIVVAVVTVAGTVLVALVNARANRTAPSPPAPANTAAPADVGKVREDLAVLTFRADDSDERDEMQDRRLDQIERHLDLDNPRWRHDGRP